MTETATTPAPTRSASPRMSEPASPLVTSRYDRAAGLLVALLILIGLGVFCLLVIWLTNRTAARNKAVPVLLENLGGREDGVLGESLQLDVPDRGEVAQESDLVEPEIQKSMDMINDLVAARMAQLDSPVITEDYLSGTRGGSQGEGNAPALGAGGGDIGGVPRAQRWRIEFADRTLSEYARQLDFFNIELAAVGGGQVQYATNLSATTPRKRVSSPGEKEQRLYMSWRDGSLQQFDRRLLQAAGVSTDGKVLVQFLPSDVENQLAFLEQQFEGRKPEQIRRTTFGIRPTSDGYEFYVINQEPL